ncbi:MAG: alpha/beta fold hydrolase, partial [Billgrantia desiderata]
MAFLNVDGRSVAYRLLGPEALPLVVLAHPLGMSQAVWDELLPALLPRYRVLTWDLPGHGASQAWPAEGGEITPAALAREALALVEHA